MFSSKLRTTLAALSVAGLISAAAASSAVATPTRTFDDSPVAVELSTPDRVMDVTVFPTGQGQDEEVCRGFEYRLEDITASMKEALKEGDGDRAVANAEAAANVEDMAYDAGCVVLW
jgi:hypothetical protein